MKLTAAQLRRIVRQQLLEQSMGQAKVDAPLKSFVGHLNAAKQDLAQVFQQTSDQRSTDLAQALLNGLNKMIKALDHMPELTKDPWAGVRKRD